VDWQYQNWEAAVAKWAQENELELQEPPTEYDNVHLPEYKPTIKILKPKNNDKITFRSLDLEVQASAPRGVAKVEYYIEDSLIGTATQAPFDLTGYIGDPAIGSGFYDLIATAYDGVGNRASDQISLNLMLEELPLTINLTKPQNNQVIKADSFPQELQASLSSIDNISQIVFYLEDQFGQIQVLATIKQISSTNINSIWLEEPKTGNYKIYAKAFDNQNRSFFSQKVNITIEEELEEE